jgi:3-oxoacyl-[acyl-carrier protein] reductase
MNGNDRQVIAITGGGQGIGRAIALHFSARGFDPVLLDVNVQAAQTVAAECRNEGATKAMALECDVRSSASVNPCYDRIRDEFGRLDVQINNAGIFRRERIMDSDDETTRQLIEVNLIGMINSSRAAMRIMADQEHGIIISAHSILGTFPDHGLGVYSATKAAVAVLTKVLAAECAPYGVRVNAYAPSVTDTAMVHHIIEARPAAKLAQIPMREFGVPEQIAKICWFLASDESEYTTGATIPSDGGTWAVQRPIESWKAAGKLTE